MLQTLKSIPNEKRCVNLKNQVGSTSADADDIFEISAGNLAVNYVLTSLDYMNYSKVIPLFSFFIIFLH